MSIWLLRFFIFTLMLQGCSDDTVSKVTLYEIAKKYDPKMELVIPENINAGVQCSDYGEGCVGGVTIKIFGLELIAVEYKSEQEALAYAAKIDQFYFKNWLFDDVTGEPKLEKFVFEAYGAQRARKELGLLP